MTINLRDFFYWFDSGRNANQNAAVDLLLEQLPSSLKRDDAAWVRLYRKPVRVPQDEMPSAAIDLICEFEGFRSHPYDDGMAVATIGYGSTFYEDGMPVEYSDSPIDEPTARRMMLNIAKTDFWDVLRVRIPYWNEMTEGQRGALLSFGYNVGSGFYGSPGFATITQVLSDKAWDEVPDAMRLYVNPGTSVEAGLRRRREAEIAMWTS
jgi:GH24 family phage-related lysozyme (muramidase)